MDQSSSYDSDPGSHRFNVRTASPALKAAMADLARRTGRADAEFDGMELGTAYELATSTYSGELPQFWKVWQQWNLASREPPAAMGDL